MTRGELLKYLESVAGTYRADAINSVKRNSHMNDLSTKDLSWIEENQKRIQRLIDAILVDFINAVGADQCLDYGLKTNDLGKND
ncbi:MAG: hypothetical protein Q7K65_00815 [Candidatus Buchananbacteria bacterium]|nr:hypothetical protein [Candidatus Buchananbacteria bacterium]